MTENKTGGDLVYISDILNRSRTVEQALGIPDIEKRRINIIVDEIRLGSKKVAEVLHGIAQEPSLTEYQKVYATFKFCEWMRLNQSIQGRTRKVLSKLMLR